MNEYYNYDRERLIKLREHLLRMLEIYSRLEADFTLLINEFSRANELVDPAWPDAPRILEIYQITLNDFMKNLNSIKLAKIFFEQLINFIDNILSSEA